MIVIHKSEYNPRIDFIVCKQLLCNLPYEYNELKLRESFEKKRANYRMKRILSLLKTFLKRKINKVER